MVLIMPKYQFFGIMTALLSINSNVETNVVSKGGSSLAAVVALVLAAYFFFKGEK
jgi:hypothetical protein